MIKNQEGFTIIEITIALVVVAVLGVGAVMLLKHSNPTPTNSSTLTIEGKVISIVDQGGDTCLTYVLNTNDYIAVRCPDMSGYKGFTGTYDKDIKVGDTVTANGTLKTPSTSNHKTYHLDKPGTYLQLKR